MKQDVRVWESVRECREVRGECRKVLGGVEECVGFPTLFHTWKSVWGECGGCEEMENDFTSWLRMEKYTILLCSSKKTYGSAIT